MEIIPNFEDQKLWDAFVESHPQSRFCHLLAFRSIEKTYGYKPRYFGFIKNNQLVGVLPTFETSSLFFGRRLVSQPFSEYGGFLLDPTLTEEDFKSIIEYLRQYLPDHKMTGLEMHGFFNPSSQQSDQYLTKTNLQSLAHLPLDRPLDELW